MIEFTEVNFNFSNGESDMAINDTAKLSLILYLTKIQRYSNIQKKNHIWFLTSRPNKLEAKNSGKKIANIFGWVFFWWKRALNRTCSFMLHFFLWFFYSLFVYIFFSRIYVLMRSIVVRSVFVYAILFTGTFVSFVVKHDDIYCLLACLLMFLYVTYF